MFWQIYLLLLLVGILIYRWRNRKIFNLSNQVKSDTACWPLIGHAYKFYGDTEHIFNAMTFFGQEAINKGGITGIWLGNMYIVMIADAADFEFVAKYYLDKGFLMSFIRDEIGNGSITAPVPIWRPRRKILLPAFNPKISHQFVHIFAKQSTTMVQQLDSRFSQLGNEPFSIWDYFTAYTLDSVFESVLDVNLDTQRNRGHPLLKGLELVTDVIAKRIVRPWQHNSILFRLFPSHYSLKSTMKYILHFCHKIIVSKRKEIQSRNELIENVNEKENNPKKFKSYLELLIEISGNENGYTNLELQEETMVFLMAGTDTTAVGAAFTTLMLSRYPEVQEKVYEELKEVFGNSKQLLTPEDLPRLKYLDTVIKESLRLYPPVPFIIRQADCDLTLPSGVTIVKDCVLALSVWAVNRNPQYWGPDANDFRPERWLEENTLKHPAQFVSFSHGPRNCAGYQSAMSSVKTVLSTMLRHYRVLPDTVVPTKDGALKPLRLKFEVTMKDVNNFMVRLERRV